MHQEPSNQLTNEKKTLKSYEELKGFQGVCEMTATYGYYICCKTKYITFYMHLYLMMLCVFVIKLFKIRKENEIYNGQDQMKEEN